MLIGIVTITAITGKFICSVTSYCDNNDNDGEVYRQCKQIFVQ